MPLERCQRVARKFVYTHSHRTNGVVCAVSMPLPRVLYLHFSYTLNISPSDGLRGADCIARTAVHSVAGSLFVYAPKFFFLLFFKMYCALFRYRVECVAPHNVLYIVLLLQSSSFSFAATFVMFCMLCQACEYIYIFNIVCAIETSVYAIWLRSRRQTASIGSFAFENCSYFFHSVFPSN